MLALLGRSDEALECVETYLKATKMFRNYSDPDNDPVFSEVRVGRHNHYETCWHRSYHCCIILGRWVGVVSCELILMRHENWSREQAFLVRLKMTGKQSTCVQSQRLKGAPKPHTHVQGTWLPSSF